MTLDCTLLAPRRCPPQGRLHRYEAYVEVFRVFQQNACHQSRYVVLSERGAPTVWTQHSGHCPVPVRCVPDKVALGQLAVPCQNRSASLYCNTDLMRGTSGRSQGSFRAVLKEIS